MLKNFLVYLTESVLHPVRQNRCCSDYHRLYPAQPRPSAVRWRRIVRIIQNTAIKSTTKRKSKPITDSGHNFPLAPNQFNQNFEIQSITAKGAEIIYIKGIRLTDALQSPYIPRFDTISKSSIYKELQQQPHIRWHVGFPNQQSRRHWDILKTLYYL